MKKAFIITLLLLFLPFSGCIDFDGIPFNFPDDKVNIVYGDVHLEPTWENLQLAMDDAGDGIIFLPEGTIWTEGRMYPREGNRIIGRGQDKSWIKSDRDIPANSPSQFMIPFFLHLEADNVELAYFSIDMHKNGSNAINIYSSDCHIHHIDIHRAGFSGVTCRGEANRLHIHHINCYDGNTLPPGSPTGLGCHGFGLGPIRNSTVHDCAVYGWNSGEIAYNTITAENCIGYFMENLDIHDNRCNEV